jgi:ribulose-phosphate 3-epimerase
MKHAIIPAVIPKTVEDIQKAVDFLDASAEWIQIDVADGMFASTATWPYVGGSVEDLNTVARRPKTEVHLMIQNPEKVVQEWARAGVSRILVHEESTKELGIILDSMAGTGVEVGVVLKLETSIETFEPWIDRISVVQLMAIAEIGAYGEPFAEAVIPKIESLRLRYPNLTIEIDGGVTLERAGTLFDLGVSNLVVGSAIFKAPNPLEAFKQFVDVASSRR